MSHTSDINSQSIDSTRHGMEQKKKQPVAFDRQKRGKRGRGHYPRPKGPSAHHRASLGGIPGRLLFAARGRGGTGEPADCGWSTCFVSWMLKADARAGICWLEPGLGRLGGGLPCPM